MAKAEIRVAGEAARRTTPDVGELRLAIQAEYTDVANEPGKGFYFHIGRPLARRLDYEEEWLDGVPESSLESFAGTGNPFMLGELLAGEKVVDVGCGAGTDSLIAAGMVGAEGQVVGVDMTPAMLEKAGRGAERAGLANVEFRAGQAEALPVPDGWADVVISNGVLNLVPNKDEALAEMARVLKRRDPDAGEPGRRIQIGDILVQRAVPETAKARIDLWTG
jgi:SAM-dependent methyltransferase